MIERMALVADAAKYGPAIPPASSMPEFIARAQESELGRELKHEIP